MDFIKSLKYYWNWISCYKKHILESPFAFLCFFFLTLKYEKNLKPAAILDTILYFSQNHRGRFLGNFNVLFLTVCWTYPKPFSLLWSCSRSNPITSGLLELCSVLNGTLWNQNVYVDAEQIKHLETSLNHNKVTYVQYIFPGATYWNLSHGVSLWVIVQFRKKTKQKNNNII